MMSNIHFKLSFIQNILFIFDAVLETGSGLLFFSIKYNLE